MDSIYHVIPVGHELIQLIEDFHAERVQVKKEWFEFAEKYGSQEIYSNSSTFYGVVFEKGKVPNNWRNPKGTYRYVAIPYANRADVREAYNEYKRLKRRPGGWEFSHKACKLIECNPITQGERQTRGQAIHYITYEKIGDEYLLAVPEKAKQPSDLKQLKKSEYWTMKESQED